ncbi:MAG: F0F1 ATP synthase subunit alpha [Chloroflexi bacterium]|nr:MAG: F0F1 ATP synthase subunit alpha [Chloroflexota bacterium]
MAIRSDEITSIIRNEIKGFDEGADVSGVGTIVEVGDGIAQVYGLSGAVANELLEFPGGVMGMAFNLEEETVGVLILGEYTHLKEGDQVKTTGRIVEIPVGDALIGRVVNPLGQPIDGKGKIETSETRPVEHIAPGVIVRQPVDTPVQTGIKAIDSMIPIGRGQRELIIGDRQTGKTAIATDTIINQKGGDLICIYVAIGQKLSTVAQVVGQLEEAGAMEHSIVVVASASDPAPLQFLAPYAGATIGEAFMQQGKDALCVYDDLSKHAWAYREVSLLMRRPPGREAYPGDIFYAHSRLLERAARMSDDNGGGSLTALPIIETQAGDVSAYIPTNVISITDGQIFLQSDLFNKGQRPAVNAGISVSRVGGAAQIKAMRQVVGRLRLDLAQYRELAAFAQFSSDLDKTTRDQLNRGEKLTEVLKQPQFQPLPVERQVAILWAATNGHLDDVETRRVGEFESGFYRFLESTREQLLPSIAKDKTLSDETTAELGKAAAEFKQQEGFGKRDEAKGEDKAKGEDTAKGEDKAKGDEAKGDETKADETKADEASAGQAPSEESATAAKPEPGTEESGTEEADADATSVETTEGEPRMDEPKAAR